MPKNYYNIRDSYYKSYKKDSDNPVDVKDYVSICNGFMKFLMRKLFEEGTVLIPERMGTLNIVGRKVKISFEDGKIKGLAPDWASTKELWKEDPLAAKEKKLVYHFNEDTNGIRYKFTWSKARVLAPNKTLYNLKMTRTNKRILSSLIKQGKEYLIK